MPRPVDFQPPQPTADDLNCRLATSREDAPGHAEALAYLYGRINYEKIGNTPYTLGNYRLDRMRQLLEILGNPHRTYDIVHVAGTKGKGTVSTLLADCLSHCGRRTGLYTSPHLLRLEERIQFQGTPCSPQELVELTKAVRSAADELEERGAGRATFFELTTAVGMLHFANRGAQCAVLEVGLGGRLDSTNVCSPVATVITSISLDHQAQLGNTLEAIAREKAGIIKAGIPLICCARAAEARAVIVEMAAALGATCSLIDRDYSVRWRPSNVQTAAPGPRAEVMFHGELQPGLLHDPGNELSGKGNADSRQVGLQQLNGTWSTRLLGRHQADNIGAVLATVDVLRQRGWDLPIEKLRLAIAAAQPPARLEVVDNQPLSIIDSAHNPASILAGLDALADHFPGRPLTIIFAASRDKDWPRMLELLLPRARRLILTAYCDNPRGLPVEDLAKAASELVDATATIHSAPLEMVLSASPAEAWQRAHETLVADELVYATGSFFLAAEIMALLK